MARRDHLPLRGGQAGQALHFRARGALRVSPGPARLCLRGEPGLPEGRGAPAVGGGDPREPAQRLRQVAVGDPDRGTFGGCLMAAPQRRYRSTLPTEPAWPAWERAPAKKKAGSERRRAQGRKRRFAVLVVVPVLLMLGSIYLHTVSAGLEGRAAALEQELDTARAQGERLEVDVAKLSRSEEHTSELQS